MKIFRHVLGLGLLLLLAYGLVWAAYAPVLRPQSAEDTPEWFTRHVSQIRRILSMPPDLSLAYKGRRPSKYEGFDILELELVRGDERQPFVMGVSVDDKTVAYDRFYDLEDPFRKMRDTIRLDRAPQIGPADAPLTVVKYSDYTCSYCRKFFLIMQEKMIARYGDSIRFFHKIFPAIGLREHAQSSAVAGMCAYRQGNEQFWAMHDQLFHNVQRFGEGDPVYTELARAAGLDVVRFRACFDRQESLVDIAADQEEGIALEIDGTPTFFINGRPLGGVPSEEELYRILDEELEIARAN